MQKGVLRKDSGSLNLTHSSLLLNPAAAAATEDETVREDSHLLQGGAGQVSSSPSSSPSTPSGHSSHSHLNKQKKKYNCKKLFYDRVPKGKAPFILFLINFLESFAFYGATSYIRFTVFDESGSNKGPKSDLAFTIFYFTAGRVFYPVAGLIADVYLGRYKVIHIGLWLLWVGFAIILMGMACEWQYPHLTILRRMPGIVATVLFMLGSASVESTIIPFGVDQVQQGASSEELSSYFYWYLFGRNAGYVGNIVCLIGIQHLQTAINGWIYLTDLTNQISNTSLESPHFNAEIMDEIGNMEKSITNLTSGLIAIMAVTIAIFLLHCNQRLFFRARQLENPLRTIINVLYFAATVKRQAPRHRRSFRYGEERKPRIELAKVEFDGIYSSEEVEDVKTFLRLLLFTLSLGFPCATFGALNGMYNYVTAKMTGLPTYFNLIDSGSLLVLIPLYNHLFIPCVPSANMKRRTGLGVLFFLLSAALGFLVHWLVQEKKVTSHGLQVFCMTMPVLVLVVGILFIFVALEFIYAQSPDSMKGLLTGVFYFVFGAGSGMGVGIFYKTLLPGILYFYSTILVVSAVGLVLYVLVTLWYKNRERPTNDESESELQRRFIATKVYLEYDRDDD